MQIGCAAWNRGRGARKSPGQDPCHLLPRSPRALRLEWLRAGPMLTANGVLEARCMRSCEYIPKRSSPR
jgi:hypothetical protein